MSEISGNSSKRLYKRLIIRFILAIILLGFLVFIFPKLVKSLFPFIIALIVATIVNALVNKIDSRFNKISKKFFLPKKLTTFLLNSLVIFVLFGLIFFLFYNIIVESIQLTQSIQQNWDEIVLKIRAFQENFTWFVDRLPLQIIEILESFEESILTFIRNTSRNLLSTTVATTATVITKTSNFFVNIITFILALFFITSDYNRIGEVTLKYVNEGARGTFKMLKNSVVAAFGGYLKAQLILSLFAFVFMFIGFSIYGQEYALLIALFLAFIDLFPIIGTIAILLPWGIVEFFAGHVNTGIFLMLLGVIFFIIRRTIEPKVMGSQIGLHPLATLMSIYVGLQISGVWGAILGPITLMLLICVVKSGVFSNTIYDLKEAYKHISGLLSNKRR